jgi:hypothetical protein
MSLQPLTPPVDHRFVEQAEPLPVPLRFEASNDEPLAHTHQTIGRVLQTFGFSNIDIDAVNFGNWLRDYSQVIDPKITRSPEMPKDFPAVLSRQSWTDLIDVLAIKKFYTLRTLPQNPNAVKVTMDKLGVYRPHEHIDNPMISDPPFNDPRVRDKDFEPWVLKGNELLETDRQTSMKRYIGRSVEYMQREIATALKKGRSLDGFRHFGAALHVVEDLFAHSNFAELSLRKLGHEQVLTWTTPSDCKHSHALVTGTFGATDIIASLAGPLGKVLFSLEELHLELTQPGYRSQRDKIMLILLKEQPEQQYLNAFELYLNARDQVASLAKTFGIDILSFYRWLSTTPLAILSNAYNSVAQGILTWFGNSIGHAQTLTGNDPNVDPSIDPTHSQLSKDHFEHPLHDLAGKLATEAVRKVTQALVDHWDGKPDADPIATASSFFCHPMDCDWQDETVKRWANSNSDQVARSASKSEIDQTHQVLIRELEMSREQLRNDSKSFLDYLQNNQDEQPSYFRRVALETLKSALSQLPAWRAFESALQSVQK